MFKRMVALLLVLVMVFAAIPNAFAEETETTVAVEVDNAVEATSETQTETTSETGTELGDILGDSVQTGITADGLEYAYNDTQAVITGYSGTSETVTIPAKIGELPVLSVGYRAFYNMDSIKKVTVDSGVQILSKECFSHCDGLKHVVLPETITVIPSNCFSYCGYLEKIELSDFVTCIESGAFSFCYRLSEINWDQSLRVMGEAAFKYCRSIKSIPVLDGIAIGVDTFANSGLTEVTLKNMDVSKSAFADCAWLEKVCLDNTTLHGRAFYNCTALEIVEMSNVDAISFDTFSGCKALKEIDLSGVKEVGQNAFYQCAALETVNLSNIERISLLAFAGCASLKEAVLTNAKTIGKQSFSGCTYLARVILPDGIKNIGEGMFAGCTLLSGIYIPASVTSIASDAFSNTLFLRVYGERDSYAQTWCEDNAIPFIEGDVPEINAEIGCTADGLVYMHCNGEAYISGYSGTDVNVTIPEIVDKMPVVGLTGKVFYDNDSIKTVTIEAPLDELSESCFALCDSLTSVVLPQTLKVISSSCFSQCGKLETVEIPRTVERIESEAFYNCRKLKQIQWSENLKTIGALAFFSCASLTEIPELNGIFIGSSAFYDCDDLTKVEIRNSVLGGSAFRSCSALENVTLENVSFPDKEYSDRWGFLECYALKNISIGGVEHIGEMMFARCTSLRAIRLPDGVTTIEIEAFADCSILSAVYIPASTVSIADDIFTNDQLVTVCGEKGSYAEAWCEEHEIPFVVGDFGQLGIGDGQTDEGLKYVCSNGTVLITGCAEETTGITIPKEIDGQRVIGISPDAFKNNDVIQSIVIEAEIERLPEERCFDDCDALSSIIFPETLTVLPQSCLYSCDNLVSVRLSEKTTEIGNYAFWYCSKLSEFNWPESLQTIGIGAFENCNAIVHIPVLDGVKIGDNAFWECDGLTEISIKNTSIGASAFSKSRNLQSASLENVTTLGNKAFKECTSLEEIDLSGVTTIGQEAFSGCSALRDVKFGSIVKLEANTFYNCASLDKVILPEGLKSIAGKALAECTVLSGVYIPASVTTIADDAFNNDQFLVISAEMPEENEDGTVDTPPAVDFADKQGHKYHKIRHKHKDEGDKHNGWHGQMDHDDAKNHDGKHGMYIMTDRGWVWFDSDAVGHIQNNMGSGDLEFGWDEIDERPNSGNDRFDDRVEDVHNKGGKVYDLNLKCGGEKVEFSKDEKGSVHVDVPFEKGHENVYVYHIDDEGNKTRHDCDYDPKTGRVSFDTRHFSYYSVETVENDSVVMEKFDIAGANMTLGNELEMNVMFPKTAIDNAGTELTAYVTHYSEDGDVVHTFTEFDAYGSSYYKLSFRVAAAQMTDTIAVEFKDADGNVYNNEYTNSVRNYVMNNIGRFNTTIQTLMVDMLNYGTAAQDQFTYHQDAYANALLSDEQKALATGDVEVSDLRVKGTNYAGSTLSLEDRILLNIVFNGKFTADELAAMSATVSFDNALDGVKQTHENAAITAYGSSRFQVTVDQIVLADSSQPVTVTVYNADGSEYGSTVDSVSSYICRMDDGTNPMYSSIMKFATSALAYGQSNK